MADPTEHLNRIWAIFRRHGITDDLTIIENLAALLLERWAFERFSARDYWPDDPKLRPRVPELPIRDQDEVNEVLSLAIEATGTSPAMLFDRFIIFRLTQMIPGGRYPTPRHIAQTMVRLARVKQGDSMADFACGSGGLLVAAANLNPRVTGIEISPNWARLARTNTELHNLQGPDYSLNDQLTGKSISLFERREPPDIVVGNAFSVISRLPIETKFDCILLNPPFGENVDPYLVQELLYPAKSGRSEILFTFLGLQRLKPGGRLAILQPTGTLFSTGSAEVRLRQMLLEENNLEAVISLPKDSFQPFSGLQTHLLVIHKPGQGQTASTRQVWFYRVQHDGYSSGRNRQPEPERDELPRLEAAVPAQSLPPMRVFGENDENGIGVRVLQLPDSSICGYRFERVGETTLNFTLTRLEHPEGQLSGLLMTAQDSETRGAIYLSGQNLFGGAELERDRLNFQQVSDVPLVWRFVDDDLAGFTLSMDGKVGQISKNKKPQVTIKFRDNVDDSGNLAVIVDTKGNPLFYPLILDSLSWLKRDYPCALTLQNEKEEEAGHLLIFESAAIEGSSMGTLRDDNILLVDLHPAGRLIITFGPATDQVSHLQFLVMNATDTFESDAQRTGVVADVHGNWFGVAVPAEHILQDANLDLQPSSYFPREEQPQTFKSPAELLKNIKESQRELERRINFLLGITEMKPVIGSLVPFPALDTATPFGELNEQQHKVWQRIQGFNETVSSSEGQAYLTPRPFQPEEVAQDLSPTDVQHALDLFERMGLIVRVSIEGAPYYRYITEQDLVLPDSER